METLYVLHSSAHKHAECFTGNISLNILVSVLQIRKLRLGEGLVAYEGYTAGRV